MSRLRPKRKLSPLEDPRVLAVAVAVLSLLVFLLVQLRAIFHDLG